MRYPGGKGKVYQRLISMMPPHRVYIESHLGGGAVMRHKRSAQINIGVDSDRSIIDRWREEGSTACRLVVADAADYLRRRHFEGDELVYCDPPYVPTTRRRERVYRHDYTVEQHRELLGVLLELRCMVMISGYRCDLYDHLLRGWRRETFNAMSHVGLRQEWVWMNYPEPVALHDASHLGGSFRGRQSVRRRHERWLNRFDALESAERAHLLTLLNQRFAAVERS